MSVIKENISENTPKRKRGRPKSWHREFIESKEHAYFAPRGCTRKKVNFSYGLALMNMFTKASEEQQRDIAGCTEREVREGTAKALRWDVAAVEVGRYLESVGDDDENREAAFSTMLKARKDGMKWTQIGAHFRRLRLGERKGNALSLFMHLARAYDDYIRKFPATTEQARIGSIENLLDAVENPDE